jgi:hypothetical protein
MTSDNIKFISAPVLYGTWGNTKYIPDLYQYQYQVYTCHIPEKKSALNLIPSSDWYESSKTVLNTIPAMYREEKPPNIRTSLKAQKLIPVQNWKNW